MRLNTHRSVTMIVLLLTLLILPAGAPADESLDLTAELIHPWPVEPALLEALAANERAGVRIYFFDPASQEQGTNRTYEDTQVSPTLVGLVGALLPGEMSLEHAGSVQALRGVVDADAIRGLLEHPSVLAIELDETVETEPVRTVAGLGSTCTPSSIEACVQGSRFGIRVNMSGSATVAASSSQSAVFWRFSSANWEVVGKVLNGCPVNNHWWVFGAGATGSSYALQVFDYASGGSIGYNGAALCPIADTGQFNTFPCP